MLKKKEKKTTLQENPYLIFSIFLIGHEFME